MNALTIENFSAGNLADAAELMAQIWGEDANIPKDLQRLNNQYFARYYYAPESDFNLIATENGKFCACLLAAPADKHETASADQWLVEHLPTGEYAEHFQKLQAHLNYMREAELRYALKNEALLLFFGSVRKGAGKLLMAEFMKRCKAQSIESMLLWTNELCDYDYYYQHGFTEIAKFPASMPLGGQQLMTWFFRKHF